MHTVLVDTSIWVDHFHKGEPLLQYLMSSGQVVIHPFIIGTQAFDYWCRNYNDELYIFFANPKSKDLKFPLEYGQSLSTTVERYKVEVNLKGEIIPVTLTFNPYQSVLIKIDKQGKATDIDIHYQPEKPVYEPRKRNGKEKWEVQSPSK